MISPFLISFGTTNNYRYVNASNVYNKGKSDGIANLTLDFPSENQLPGGMSNYTKKYTIPANKSVLALFAGGRWDGYFRLNSITFPDTSSSDYTQIMAFKESSYNLMVYVYRFVNNSKTKYIQFNGIQGSCLFRLLYV